MTCEIPRAESQYARRRKISSRYRRSSLASASKPRLLFPFSTNDPSRRGDSAIVLTIFDPLFFRPTIAKSGLSDSARISGTPRRASPRPAPPHPTPPLARNFIGELFISKRLIVGRGFGRICSDSCTITVGEYIFYKPRLCSGPFQRFL